jgi:hypothetical protein
LPGFNGIIKPLTDKDFLLGVDQNNANTRAIRAQMVINHGLTSNLLGA